MAAIAEINVSLPSEMIDVVQQALDTGEYSSVSEVVAEALRTWTASRSQKYDVDHLRSAWNEALADPNPGLEMDEVFDSLDSRYKSMAEEAATS
jgi:antitoxin ParD1/3/4